MNSDIQQPYNVCPWGHGVPFRTVLLGGWWHHIEVLYPPVPSFLESFMSMLSTGFQAVVVTGKQVLPMLEIM